MFGLNGSAQQQLRIIGHELDRDIYPEGRRAGIVKSVNSGSLFESRLLEGNDDGQGTRRSETESREWATGRQGSTGGTWPPDSTTSLLGRSGPQDLRSALSGLEDAYPGARVEFREDGFWIRASSRLLEGSTRWAEFVVAVPYCAGWGIQAWGFWQGSSWIGPRHTNFPLGSICAIYPSDGAWRMGDSFVTLLDIYSLWAVRHLHLEVFGRWPGRQKARWAFERIIEAKPDELCGCGSAKEYAECCRQADLKGDYETMRLEFLRETGGGTRNTPSVLTDVLKGKAPLPLVQPYAFPPGTLH
jgi:hypothetical protein